ALLFATAGTGATASGIGAGGLPAGWTHAEINVFVNGSAHTLILDRGRVTSGSASVISLREQDGTAQQITLAASTQIVANGAPGTLSMIRPGETAVTQRIDGGPATSVRLTIPPRLARKLGR
ncbi:MAG TPA: hypothetical protein VGL76_04035, partial [Gaiellaceae bacterium]